MNSAKGEQHPNWRGGKYVTEQGYIRFSGGPHRGEYEHRVVWAEINGPIPKDKDVHHINEIRTDNAPENLELKPADLHRREALARWNKRRTEERLQRESQRCRNGSGTREVTARYIKEKGRLAAHAIRSARDRTCG